MKVKKINTLTCNFSSSFNQTIIFMFLLKV